jgi:large subunit ribosomal protein L15
MEQIGLGSLRPAEPRRGRKRVGRGPGSGHGKTSGKGHKGQKARSGGVKGPAFEGGQLPLQRRLPKRGFTNAPFARRWRIVNLVVLERLPAGVEANPETLGEAGLIPRNGLPLKVLAMGELEAARTVRAHSFSAAARAKIEAAGGTAVVLDDGPRAGA